MKRLRLILALGIVCMITGVTMTTILVSDYRTGYERHLGEEYIFGKDTLVITNYSVIHDDYILSNGAEISAAIIRNRE
jgi:hypothetical protein